MDEVGGVQMWVLWDVNGLDIGVMDPDPDPVGSLIICKI